VDAQDIQRERVRGRFSIAEDQELADGRNGVECEPDARYDDDPSFIARRIRVRPDFAHIEFGDITMVSLRSRYGLSQFGFAGALRG
jgi:hypothetical protein